MELSVKGLQEVDAALVRLGSVAGAKVMRQAMFAASKPILDQAKANIARWQGGSGALHLAMGRRFVAGSGNQFKIEIGPRRKAPAAIALHNLYYKRDVKGIFYGHLLEFGHRIRTRGGVFSGTVAPKRFLRPALDTGGIRASFLLGHELRRRVERALKKLDPAVSSD